VNNRYLGWPQAEAPEPPQLLQPCKLGLRLIVISEPPAESVRRARTAAPTFTVDRLLLGESEPIRTLASNGGTVVAVDTVGVYPLWAGLLDRPG
jgi:hypothetical protein